MMDFEPEPEQLLLGDAATRFVRERCTFELWQGERAQGRALGATLWPEFAAMGWLALPFAEADGGFAAGPIETMLLMQPLGRGLVGEPYLHGCVLAAALLHHSEPGATRSARIEGLHSGSTRVAVAHGETASRYALAQVGCRAQREGTRWRLTGSKALALGADSANALIVSAAGDAGVTLFWIDADTPGLVRQRRALVDANSGAELTLHDVLLDDSARVGAVGAGLTLMHDASQQLLAAMGAEALGLMDLLLEQTMTYTSTRRQFGQPVARFQALRHRMVDMFMMAEQMRSLVLLATLRLAEGHADAPRALAAMKVQLGQAGRYISQQAVQLHGGMGMTDEIVVGHAFKRLLALDALWGNADHHLQAFVAASA